MNRVKRFSCGLLLSIVFAANAFAAPRSTPVAVVNTDSEPVPVTVVERPTAINVCATLGPFSGPRQPIYNVPADVMWMIEYASIDPVDTMEEGHFVQVSIKTTAGGEEGTFVAGKVSGSEFTFGRDGRALKVYAEPATEVVGSVGIRGYLGDVEICLSGRLIPAD